MLLSNTCRAIARGVHAGLGDAPADLEGARRDAGVPERPGVGDDAEVERPRRCRGDRGTPSASMTSTHHLGARGVRAVEPVDGAVPGVAEVMVDVDGAVALEPGDARAATGRRTPSRTARRTRRRRTAPPRCRATPSKSSVVRGRRVAVDDAHLLAQRAQRERHRHLRSDGVAVGPRVRGQQEPRAARARRRRSRASRSDLSGLVVGGGVVIVGARGAPGSPAGAARSAARGRRTRRT